MSSGEISPLLVGRTDYQRHQTGLATCRGFIPLREGGITRAPGTLYRGRTEVDARGLLLPFVFGVDDALTLEFTPQVMRVWRYGALVMDGASPFALATGFGLGAINRMQTVQSADVIYIADGERAPKKLSRRALDDWTIEDFEPSGGPLRVENGDEALTVSASAGTGTVTLTASADLFQAGHAGGLFGLRVRDWATIPLWTGNTPVDVGDRMRFDGQVYEVVSLGLAMNTGVNAPTHLAGDALAAKDGVTWRHLYDDRGLVRITAVVSATEATATVLRRLPDELVGAGTSFWAEGAWSDLHGWPAAVAISGGRLYLGGTTRDPRTIWGSALGAFEDFESTGLADGAFSYAIDGTRSLNRIVWLAGGARGLHVGGEGEQHSARSTERFEALTFENAFFALDATIGAHGKPPVMPDGRPIFVSRDQRRIHELRYRFEDDAVSAVELSLPAEHLGAGGFDEIAWQYAPLRMGWITRRTDVPCVMVYDPGEEVLGWAPYPIAGGTVESVSVTPGLDGEDDVLMIVKRVVGGETRRYVEQVAPFYGILTGELDISQANHLFAGVAYEPASETAAFDGLDHLEGEEVLAWTDKGQMGPFTVQGGAVELDVPVNRARIGLNDETQEAETLDLYAAVPAGDPMGRPTRARGVGVRVHRTGGWRQRSIGRRFGQPDISSDWRPVSEGRVPGDLVSGFSGVHREALESGWSNGVSLRFAPLGAAPLTILAVTPEVEARS